MTSHAQPDLRQMVDIRNRVHHNGDALPDTLLRGTTMHRLSALTLLAAAAAVVAGCSSAGKTGAPADTTASASAISAPTVDQLNAPDPATADQWTTADDEFLSYLGPDVTHGAQHNSANAYALVVAGQTDCLSEAAGTQSFVKPAGLTETDDDAKLIWQAAIMNLCPDALSQSGN